MAEKTILPPHMFACLDASGEYLVEVELPGVKKKDIDLALRRMREMKGRLGL